MRRNLLAALAAALLLAGCRGEPPAAKHVVLVTLDTLRADHIGAYGGDVATPNLDRLAAAGALIEQATAHSPLTRPSHTSMLTGLLPTRTGVRDNVSPTVVPEVPLLAEAAHYHLGLALEDQGRPRESAAAYRRELELRPEAYRAAFNLGRLLAPARRTAEAAEQFRSSVGTRPEFGTGHLYLAKALLDLGDLEGAEGAARRGLEASPEPDIAPLGHYVLADVYNRLGRARDAEREAAAARRLERATAGP